MLPEVYVVTSGAKALAAYTDMVQAQKGVAAACFHGHRDARVQMVCVDPDLLSLLDAEKETRKKQEKWARRQQDIEDTRNAVVSGLTRQARGLHLLGKVSEAELTGFRKAMDGVCRHDTWDAVRRDADARIIEAGYGHVLEDIRAWKGEDIRRHYIQTKKQEFLEGKISTDDWIDVLLKEHETRWETGPYKFSCYAEWQELERRVGLTRNQRHAFECRFC